MLDQDKVHFLARFVAIEIVLTKVFAMATLNLPDEKFDRLIENWSDGIDRETWEGEDAATSALLSGEIRDQLLDLLNATKEVRQEIAELIGEPLV